METEMKEQQFRALTENEMAIVSKLLSPEFQGKVQLAQQANQLRARLAKSDDEYGSLELKTDYEESANVTQRVPVEAELIDSDGVPVYVLLHVSDGMLDELEIYKADGGSIVNKIDPAKLKVTVRDS